MSNEILDNYNEEGPQNVRFAGFWIRVGASLVDFLVILPIAGTGIYNLLEWKSLPLAILLIIAQAIYKPFMEYKYGATVGKMATKIKVVTTDFKPLTINHAILRDGFYLLSFLATIVTNFTLFSNPEFLALNDMFELSAWQESQPPDYMSLFASTLLMTALFFVGIDPEKQGLHDKMAGTYCIYR